MRIRLRSVIAVALLSAFGSSSLWAQSPSSSDQIVVPVLTPLTGPLAILGQDGKKGLEIAAQEINESGGIAGRKIVFEFADSQGKPDVARREMERFVRLQNVPLVVGADISASTSTAAQFAEASRTPLFNIAAVSSEIINRHYHWYFSQQVTSDNEADTVVSFLTSLTEPKGGIKSQRIALLYEDSPRGADTGELVRKLLGKTGVKAVVETSYNRAERNLLPVMKKVQEANPTILVWAGYTEDVVAGLKALKQLDFTPYVVGVGGGPGDPRLPQLVDPEFIDRLHLCNVDYFNPDLKKVAYLTEHYHKRYNALPSSYVGFSYAGGITLKTVLEKVYKKTPTPTRDDMQAALRELDLSIDKTAIPGAIKFDADGRNIGAQALVAQWKSGASRKTTVFPATIATASPTPLK
jgi:branched-chain amino acid transport system substrate-binding protein